MKSTQEFNTFYNTELEPTFAELDLLRKKSLTKVFRDIIIMIVSLLVLFGIGFLINHAILGTYFSADDPNIPLIVCAGLSIVGIIYFLGGIFKTIDRFKSSYKSRIIKPIVEFIEPSLNYDPKNFINQNQFEKSEIFKDKISKYTGDDYVEGTVGKTKIRFSEIHAQSNSPHNDPDLSARSDKYNPIFDGLFFIADFNKNFKGAYFALPDKAEKLFGKFGQKFQKLSIGRGKLVTLEDPEFEKLFAVYGSDQVEARYIFSSSLMARITELKRHFEKNVYFSFIDSSVYIAIAQPANLFEPQLFKTVDNRLMITSFFTLLSEIIGIVDELNLNTRIWGKE